MGSRMRWRAFIKLRYIPGYVSFTCVEPLLKFFQAGVYDATRKRLLCGREDMLGLVAAQLKYKVETKALQSGKAVWVDVSDSLHIRECVDYFC